MMTMNDLILLSLYTKSLSQSGTGVTNPSADTNSQQMIQYYSYSITLKCDRKHYELLRFHKHNNYFGHRILPPSSLTTGNGKRSIF